MSKLFLGSVAEQVLRSVNLPVITVGPEAHLAVTGNDQQKVVLYATTLRETSRPSAALACQIAASQNAKLVLLHVLPHIGDKVRDELPTGLDSEAMQELRALADETGASESGCCAQVEARIAHGNPSIEILAASAELQASLIVLGSTRRSALQNLARDRTIVVVEHDMVFVRSLGAKVTVLHEGSVLAEGSIDAVQNHPRVIEVYLGR